MKKTWQTPKLITLVRSAPEEAVLTSCKAESPPWVSPSYWYSYCDIGDGSCTGCAQVTSS